MCTLATVHKSSPKPRTISSLHHTFFLHVLGKTLKGPTLKLAGVSVVRFPAVSPMGADIDIFIKTFSKEI